MNKKIASKKLSLAKETLRALNGAELAGVAGGSANVALGGGVGVPGDSVLNPCLPASVLVGGLASIDPEGRCGSNPIGNSIFIRPAP